MRKVYEPDLINGTLKPPLVLFQYINGSHCVHSYTSLNAVNNRYVVAEPYEVRAKRRDFKPYNLGASGASSAIQTKAMREQESKWLELSKTG